MQLRGKQKRYLRSRANQMRAIFEIGKQGVSTRWLAQLTNVLNKRELVKIKILPNSGESVSDVRKFIQTHSEIQVVQKLGKTLLLFKPAQQAKYQKISQIVAKM